MDHFIIIWDLVGPNGVEKEIEMSFDETINNGSRPKLPVWRNFVHLKCSNVHRNYVDCARFYGDIIISKSASVDSTLAAWMPTKLVEDTAPMKTQVDVLFQYELTFCKSWFMKFCLDPSKRFLALGFTDGRIMIMDLHSSEDPTDLRILYLQGKSDRQGLIREISFSPDGKILIAVCDKAKVFKYNVKSCHTREFVKAEPDA